MDIKKITINGIIITKEEFEEAKVQGVRRWLSYSNGKKPENPCFFCRIFARSSIHKHCPMHDGIIPAGSCCKEWSAWAEKVRYIVEELTPAFIEEGKTEARAVLKKIRSLSWNKWALKHVDTSELLVALRVGDIFYSSHKDGITGIFKVVYDLTAPTPNLEPGKDMIINWIHTFGVDYTEHKKWPHGVVVVKQLLSLPYSGKDEYSLEMNNAIKLHETAIYEPKEVKKDTEATKHTKGEVCTAPREPHVPHGIYVFDELGLPKRNEYFYNSDSMIDKAPTDFTRTKRWILKRVEPKFKVGDYVVWMNKTRKVLKHYIIPIPTSIQQSDSSKPIFPTEIVYVLDASRGFATDDLYGKNVPESELRHAIPSDFDVERGGVRVRMEETYGDIIAVFTGNTWVNTEKLCTIKVAIYKIAGIRIVPKSVTDRARA